MNPERLATALRANQVAKDNDWVTAAIGYYMTGDGTLTKRAYAHVLRKDPSVISRRMLAYSLLLFVRKNAKIRQDALNIRELRMGLDMKIWSTVGVLQKKYEFGPDKALEYLYHAYIHRTSSPSMALIIIGEQDPEKREWVARVGRIMVQVDKLRDDYGFPDEANTLIDEIIILINAIEEIAKNEDT